ncbi:MAG: hypothetical protein IT582_09220 [Opitutaceae bacterium]|nr:hypothetical protein [Opitutaceae bacterium]
MTPAFSGELESEKPLRAPRGKVDLRGWCAGEDKAPAEIRLHNGSHIIAATLGAPRPDLPPGARAFALRGQLPAGVHWAEFQARSADGAWLTFRQYSLRATAAGLVGQIESHPPDKTITQRTHLHGWIQTDRSQIESLALHYGHQSIPCELGVTRLDAAEKCAAAQPAIAFKTRFILSAGRGAIRLVAKLVDGSRAILRTGLQVEIGTDENHGPDFNFAAECLALPRQTIPTIPPPPSTDRPLNVCFILHGSFAANSALHVTALANELSLAGHGCVVAVTHDLETFQHLRAPRFEPVLHARASHGVIFPDGRGPDLIHAWTTREQVRRLAESLRSRHHAKLIVHLEDNEQTVAAAELGRDAASLQAMPDAELDRLIPPHLTHPHRGPAFLASADAVTLITESLADFVPPTLRRIVLWPAADERFFHPRRAPADFLGIWKRRPDETVLFYHGNVHAANAAEMRELYLAVFQLNRAGQITTLLRTGLDSVDFLGADAAACAPHVIELGLISGHHRLPDLMALADIFVQPGVDDAFNHYRFPSKLPEFFSIGRPVILPRTNLGAQLRHGVDAFVLDRADATGIAHAVATLRADPALAARLGAGAIAFARENFSWRGAAEKLALFYAGLVAR